MNNIFLTYIKIFFYRKEFYLFHFFIYLIFNVFILLSFT